MCSTESEPETDQPTLEELAGLYLFTPDELSVYLDLKAASKDMSLTKKERRIKRGHAVRKLRIVIEKRMPLTEKLVLEANKQAETDRKMTEKLVLEANKQAETDRKMTEKLVLEANKQAERDRKHQENIQFIEKALSLSALQNNSRITMPF
jgi:hypothetical protein